MGAVRATFIGSVRKPVASLCVCVCVGVGVCVCVIKVRCLPQSQHRNIETNVSMPGPTCGDTPDNYAFVIK